MEDHEKKQLEFVMTVGVRMKNYLQDCLMKTFQTHEERSHAFYSTMINFVANTMAEISQPERLEANMREIIDGLEDWLKGDDVKVYKYNLNTNEIKKEDLH